MPRSALPVSQTPHQLLLVDDDALIRETLAEFLHSEGFRVTAAQDGESAEAFLRAANPPFDLVLTDLVMPGKGGMDVLRAALQINPSCTVLVLSGFGSVREANEAMDQGAYGLVNKPFHLDQLRNILRRIMERIALLEEGERLRAEVASLQARVEILEATKGRMEMLAQRFSPTPEARDDYLEGLERLADLRTRGLLSETEFEAAKRGHLAKWYK
ncbi:response regulator [Holophaga foetida]|uniref:response regulator n=1 Tax=Holophaga foetida TaxID=35839 RepID=UPI0002472AB3|nr:response regulator [Holophaga foetida]